MWLWDVAAGRIQKVLKGHKTSIWSISFSPDGKMLASVSGHKRSREDQPPELKLWDLATGQELANLKGHSEKIVSVAFSPDGKKLATGGQDKKARLWDVATK